MTEYYLNDSPHLFSETQAALSYIVVDFVSQYWLYIANKVTLEAWTRLT